MISIMTADRQTGFVIFNAGSLPDTGNKDVFIF
jgi:hypothetical protein